ncbi:hypothetical protein [Nitrosopumilus sp. S4]
MVSKGVGLVIALLVVTISFTPAFALTELERVTITDPRLENGVGVKMGNDVNVNQHIQISATIQNNQDKVQDFLYAVQIKDQEGFVVALSWIAGLQLTPNQKFNPSISWLPTEEGEFNVEIYVWNDFKNKIDELGFSALSDYSTFVIRVS